MKPKKNEKKFANTGSCIHCPMNRRKYKEGVVCKEQRKKLFNILDMSNKLNSFLLLDFIILSLDNTVPMAMPMLTPTGIPNPILSNIVNPNTTPKIIPRDIKMAR
jgi:hypothetical protein